MLGDLNIAEPKVLRLAGPRVIEQPCRAAGGLSEFRRHGMVDLIADAAS